LGNIQRIKMKYFLDHPQIKRKKALGNGSTPSKTNPLTGATKPATKSVGQQPSPDISDSSIKTSTKGVK